MSVDVLYRGRSYAISLDTDGHVMSVGDLGLRCATATGASFETLKLLLNKRTLVPSVTPNDTLAAAGTFPPSSSSNGGIAPGMKIRMLGSTAIEVDGVRRAVELPALRGFEQEDLRAMRRRKRHTTTTALPTGPHVFKQFEAWDVASLSPPPSEALTLLHRLAADPGIAGIMKKHGYTVGKLSEMPPEGKVGVSPVCILGVNINAGQEISLRLRTDDLQGFRRYLKIRETLCHELAHMEWGEHDNNFKTLNSLLLQECGQFDWTSSGVHTESQVAQGFAWGPAVDPDDVMAVTAQSSGTALGGSTAGATADARTAAARAALRRIDSFQGGNAQRALTPLTVGAEGTIRATEGVNDEESGGIQGLGHRDRDTERLERAMQRLGSVKSDTLPSVEKSSGVAKSGGEAAPSDCEGRRLTLAVAEASDELPLKLQGIAEVQPAAQQLDSLMMDPSEGVSATTGSNATAAADTLMLPADPPARSPAATERMQSNGGAQQPRVENAAEAGDTSPELSRSPVGADGAAERYQRLQRALQSLQTAAATEDEASTALSTLATILRNALSAPQDLRFRRVRQANPAFSRRVGRFPQALEVLQVAGFQPAAADAEGPVLMLQRDDPGLLWLALSAVQTAMASG